MFQVHANALGLVNSTPSLLVVDVVCGCLGIYETGYSQTKGGNLGYAHEFSGSPIPSPWWGSGC